ncbi:MAG TPA: T9SS type A sorting domain-containing protein [Puia sp.]|jgi:hypothetical protein
MKPINYIRLGVLTILPAFSLSGLRAQGLHLTPGSNWVVSGSPCLVLNNAGLTNNGNFFADSSTVLFTGDRMTSGSFIGGDRAVSFFNLIISKSSYDVQLNNDAVVTGMIIMDSGNLQLNRYSIDLGSSGRIAGERNTSCITGERGGTIRRTTTLHAPNSVNPGNIGVEITSDADLGSTVVTRGYGQLTNSEGVASIQRWYDIVREANTNAPVRLRFFYLDGELAGKDKNALTVYSTRDRGGDWSAWGKDASDPVGNWVLKTGITSGSRFILAKGLPPLSPRPAGSIASVQIYPNPSHNTFSMEIVSEKEGNGIVRLYDISGHSLEEKMVYWKAGVTRIDWDISKYAAGVYYLSPGNQFGGTVNVVKQ